MKIGGMNMKRWIGLLLLITPLLLNAKQGDSCNDAIPVDIEYSGSFAAGEYWFTATTDALPLTIYYYPEDTTVGAPEVWIDLTCTPGVYDDTIVAKMLQTADQYGLSFPMREVPDKQYDENGQIYYSIVYDRNYRDMLYNQGVTYSIPAYVKLITQTQASVEIVSTSVNARCREYVNTFGLNTSLRVQPADSVYVHLWPLGEWINKTYRITWSCGSMELVDGKDCQLTHYSRVYRQYDMSADTITMRPRLASEWINDIYQTDLYVRLFAQLEGVLRIEEFQEVNRLIAVIVNGVQAAIDHDAKTITIVLPKGTSKANIMKAVKAAAIEYESYDGSVPSFNNKATQLTFGDKVYTVNSSAATDEGSTDATLDSIKIDGVMIDKFSPATLNYPKVEVASGIPTVTVVTADTAARVVITQANAVPGTATIVVTAKAGNTQTYTVQFIAGRSKDASLASVAIDGRAVTLIAGETSYRSTVSKLPTLTATATDPNATVYIEQARGVPGFAQVRVTAEAGNVTNYTFAFVMDPRFEPCLAATPSIALNTPVVLTPSEPDAVYNIPIKDWTDQYIRFEFDGDADLRVYLGTSCFFDPLNPDETLLDSFLVAIPKGESTRYYDFRPDDLKDLSHRSLDGTLYLRFRIAGDGNLTLTNWIETCLTQSTLLDIPSVNAIVADAREKYKIYLPDWINKTIQVKWNGTSAATMYVADACNFYLTADNIHVMQPSPYDFVAGLDSITVTPEVASAWNSSVDDGFAYLRFVNTMAGTISISDITPHEGGTAVRNAEQSDLCCYLADGEWHLLAQQPLQVTIYTMAGTLVETLNLQANTPTTLTLPQGVFILHSTDGVKKLINYN